MKLTKKNKLWLETVMIIKKNISKNSNWHCVPPRKFSAEVARVRIEPLRPR